MELFYDKVVEKIEYNDLEEWQIPNLNSFSKNINELFPYQIKAIKNIIKLLYLYYSNKENKELLYDECQRIGLSKSKFDIPQYIRNQENELFNVLKKYYPSVEINEKKYIPGYQLFNRASFWMATASGKTIIIIKLIEILDYLQQRNLIPKKDIMILFPDVNIENQFKKEIKKYNYLKNKKIQVNSLKNYDEIKNYQNLIDDINIFSYRSDLLSEEEKTKRINVNSYDNNGDWFVFMDEAHKGEKSGDSKRQNFVTQLSRNGFLFNFSATFTDSLDYATTIYNYNLEKFINDGYGKNIFLSNTYFTFNKKDELNEKQKQKQVLKSMIVYTLIKKHKQKKYYHNPLMVTLVDTVNDEDSDLYMFFKEVEKIAIGEIESDIFEEAKSELKEELISGSEYSLGNEKLKNNYHKDIEDINIKDILNNVYNSDTFGKIEIKMGEASKEIAMQLETASTPFLLIKIGDANKFKREKLGSNYQVGKNYSNIQYFNSLNDINSKINILLGSRAFYEGWDSNRPNVINFINIGSKDAKKFVIQSIGRGVRIQPKPWDNNDRKRANINESYKDELLETLFVFATNKNAITSILDVLNEQKIEKDILLKNIKVNKPKFDLLIASYGKKNKKEKNKIKFNISNNCFEKLKDNFYKFDKSLFMILFNINSKEYENLEETIKTKSIYNFNDYYDYQNIKDVFYKIIELLRQKEYIVNDILVMPKEMINHYEGIKVSVSEEKAKDIDDFIANFVNEDDNNDELKALKEKLGEGKINIDEYTENVIKLKNIHQNNIYNSELVLLKIMEHYYSPIIMTTSENIDYIKHVINVKSEKEFIEKLIKKISDSKFNSSWFFSKIDQTIDNIYIWYYNPKTNKYDKFYPDFIFWIKNNNEYKIVFVDPKGLQNVDYQFKIEGFKALFEENNKEKKFLYIDEDNNKYNISFKLLLVGETNLVPDYYKKYCTDNNDFSWIE